MNIRNNTGDRELDKLALPEVISPLDTEIRCPKAGGTVTVKQARKYCNQDQQCMGCTECFDY